MNNNKDSKIKRIFRLLYLKVIRTNTSVGNLALGFGLGVFTGVLPGTGPVVSLLLATIFKLNKGMAVLGSLLTNTWISVVTFLISIKVGANLLGLDKNKVLEDWNALLKDFHWVKLFEASVLRVALPVVAGYLLVSFCIGLIASIIIWLLIILIRALRNKVKAKNILR